MSSGRIFPSSTSGTCPTIRRFHDARSTARDDRESCLAQKTSRRHTRGVLRVCGQEPGRSKNRDSRTQLGERLEAHSTNSPMIRKTLHASGAIDGARGAPGVAPRRNLSSSVSPYRPERVAEGSGSVAAPSSTRSGSAPRSPPRSESPPPASRCMICLLPDGAPRGELHLQPPANRHPLIQLLFRSTATRPFRSISPCEQGPRRGGQTGSHPSSSRILDDRYGFDRTTNRATLLSGRPPHTRHLQSDGVSEPRER